MYVILNDVINEIIYIVFVLYTHICAFDLQNPEQQKQKREQRWAAVAKKGAYNKNSYKNKPMQNGTVGTSG